MEKEVFKYQLVKATKKAIEFVQTLVSNSVSENVVYIIEPNNRAVSNHLNKNELCNLRELNTLEENLFKVDQVVELLYKNGKTPVWISIDFYHTNKRRSIVKLITSRRYRQLDELSTKTGEHSPFNLAISLPPWRKEGAKFNANWQHQKWHQKWFNYRLKK